MDFTSIIGMIVGFVPPAVYVASFAVIVFVYFTQFVVSKVEAVVEGKAGKQIAFFDHKRVWLTIFWAIIFTVVLVLGKFITWQESLLYLLVIMGLSGILYNGFLKKFINV